MSWEGVPDKVFLGVALRGMVNSKCCAVSVVVLGGCGMGVVGMAILKGGGLGLQVETDTSTVELGCLTVLEGWVRKGRDWGEHQW